MSPDVLHNQLAALRQRVRRVIFVRGASWLAIVLIGSLLIEGVADWLLHFDDPFLRLIFAGCIAATAAWILRSRLFVPLSANLADVDLALAIEQHHPGFADALASSVQFADAAGDLRLGSMELQEAVIAAAQRRLEMIDCTEIVNTRLVRRIGAIALVVIGTTILVVLLHRQATSIALRRLLLPFSGPAWPRRTNLRFLNEDLSPLVVDGSGRLSLVQGDTLKLIVENSSGRLPPRVKLEVRPVGGNDIGKLLVDPMRPTTLKAADGSEHEVAVGRLLSSKSDLEFRATGGDDDQMPWLRLEVVPPPVVERLEISITPPAYALRSIEELPVGVGHVTGLLGSRVTVVAESAEPISKALLHVGDAPGQPVFLSNNGRRLEASFRIDQAGTHAWWLELTNTSGFTDADPPHYEVRGLQDSEPEIYIEQPIADLHATADATIRIRTEARDDLGLKELRLVCEREAVDPKVELNIPLYPPPGSDSRDQSAVTELRPLELRIEYEWRLSELRLTPGSRIVFHTEATDHFDLSSELPDGPPFPVHVGRSASRTITIVSAEEKSRELAQRQEGILADLDRAQKLQQQARGQIDDLALQLQTVSESRAEDRDVLQRAEIAQRELATQLVGTANGLTRRAADLVDELRANHLNEPRTERRLQRLANELSELELKHLNPIDQQLTQARKLMQSATKEEQGERPGDLLARASQHQATVSETLGEMLQDLSQWHSENEAASEVSDLVKQQGDLNQRTAEIAAKTLTKPLAELPAQDRANLAKIAEQQKRQAEQLEQLESRMRANHESLTESDPAAAAVLSEASEQLRRDAIAGQMRDAADQIGSNQMGQASRQQQDLLQKLRDLENRLRPNLEADTEMLVKKLKNAEQDLASLGKQQSELLRKTEEARQQPDAVQRAERLQKIKQEQSRLRDESSQLSRRLARMDANKASVSMNRATQRMQQALEKLESGSESDAEIAQQESLDDLDQAGRELASQRREEEETLASEQLTKIADELTALAERQDGANAETRRLETLRANAGTWNRPQLAALRDVAKVQQELTGEASRLAVRMSASEVIALALKGVARAMGEAVAQLENRNAGEEAQRHQEAAARRLAALISALKPEQQAAATMQNGPEESGGQSGNSSGASQGEKIPALAQISLLIAMQQDLLDRTARIDRLRDNQGKLPAETVDELEAIVREQGEIADLFRRLAQEIDGDADDNESANADQKKESEGSR